MKKYSIKDIARLSGVSVATVSRVINNNGRFSDETKQKVLKVIQETGYQMNYSAKSLRMNRSYTIGIIVPDITNYFFAKVIESIEGELFTKGYSTIICNTGRDSKKEESYLQMLEGKGVDGLIIISGSKTFSFHSHAEKPIPYICIDREPENLSNTIFISSDHFGGAYQATKYLLKHGSRNPIMVTHPRNSTSSIARKKGFFKALNEQQISFNPEKQLLLFDPDNPNLKRITLDFFVDHPEIDSVFAVNDFLALELMTLFSQNGYLSHHKIIGFDDTPSCRYSTPTLSSVKQNTKEIAKISVKKLLHLLDFSNDLGKTYTIPVELIIRGSANIS